MSCAANWTLKSEGLYKGYAPNKQTQPKKGTNEMDKNKVYATLKEVVGSIILAAMAVATIGLMCIASGYHWE